MSLRAYLRTPFRLSQQPHEEEIPHGERQELEVRQTARRILATHLVFRGATFGGSARFDLAAFSADALFGGMRHLDSGDVQDGATFRQGATFTGATFARAPVFDYVQADEASVGLPNQDGSVELD